MFMLEIQTLLIHHDVKLYSSLEKLRWKIIKEHKFIIIIIFKKIESFKFYRNEMTNITNHIKSRYAFVV